MIDQPPTSPGPTRHAGPSPARVLIVDDHPIVRKGYALLIGNQQDLQICGEAASKDEAIDQVGKTSPHLLIVDIRLKDSDGIDLIKQLKSQRPHVRILVVSALDEDLFAERAIQAGALGYMNKEEATENLIEAIRTVLRGELYLSERTTKRLLRRRVGCDLAGATSPIQALTDRELFVFRLIGQGLSTRRIAAEMQLSAKTIERYRENIKAKLELADATELVRRATQWVLENP